MEKRYQSNPYSNRVPTKTAKHNSISHYRRTTLEQESVVFLDLNPG